METLKEGVTLLLGLPALSSPFCPFPPSPSLPNPLPSIFSLKANFKPFFRTLSTALKKA